jgi:broad specificity phosphatase PhoE
MLSPVRIYLVRHGRASAGFAEAVDPGLDEIGREQAKAVAQEFAPLGPLPLITSPLKRARETAAAFETQWAVTAQVEPRIAEIPSPTEDLPARAAWLYQAFRGRWNDLPIIYQTWRDSVVSFLLSRKTTSVMTTHFVAINAAVGAATSDDRMLCFEPDHCSCTVLEVVNNSLQIVTLGRQRVTQIR